MAYGLVYTFPEELAKGTFNFSTHTFKAAFYTAALDAATVTAYSATNEVSGGSYSAGGATATLTLSRSSNVTTLSMSDLVITVPQACVSWMLYDVSASNKAVLVAPLTGVSGAGSLTVRWNVPLLTLTV